MNKRRILNLTLFVVVLLFCLLSLCFLFNSELRVAAEKSAQAETQEIEEKAQEEEEQVAQEKVRAHQIAIAKAEATIKRREEAQQNTLEGKLRSGNYDQENLKIVFLTFDDGPDEYSDEVLDILKNNDVKATFFTNGRSGRAFDDIYKRILLEGHTLANHTWSHSYSIYKNTENFLPDVEKLRSFQENLTGIPSTKIFRFPGGSQTANQTVIDSVVSAGYNYVDWNVEIGDGTSNKVTPEEAYEKIIDGVHQHSVSVVLLHSERPAKAAGREVLDQVIKQLKTEGYSFLSIKSEYQLPRFVQPTGSALPTVSDPGLK